MIAETWNRLLDVFASKTSLFFDTAFEMLPNLVVALFVILFFYFLAAFLRGPTYKAMKKSRFSNALNKLIATTVFIVVLLLGFVIALQVLNLEKTVVSLLAGAGIAGVALAFAFQDSAANFLSGIILAVKQPFKLTDLIETNGFQGHVKEIGLRTTTVNALQGQVVEIANKDVLQNPLINYTTSKERRVDIDIGVSYSDDLVKAKKVAIAAVKKVKSRDKERDPDLFYKEFGDSSINFTVRFWMPFSNKQSEYWAARSDAIINIKKSFDKEGITIPFPIRTLDVDEKTVKSLRSK